MTRSTGALARRYARALLDVAAAQGQTTPLELRAELRGCASGLEAHAGLRRALAQPTLGDGETYNELLQDRSAFEDFDIDRARTQGYGFARLQRLSIEHLLGTR